MLPQKSVVQFYKKKLPENIKDLESLSRGPLEMLFLKKALCDLRASINLMQLTIFRKLGIREAKLTTVTLLLADRSLKHQRGFIEDVLVKVDKFIFPTNFIMLDMEEDKEYP